LTGELIETLNGIIRPVVEARGLELVDVELVPEEVGRVLRVVIDRAGGVGVNDCEDVARMLGVVLDTHDPIAERYVLEVTSPGIYRRLRREADLPRFTGQRVKAVLREPVHGQHVLTGILTDARDGIVTLAFPDGRTAVTSWDNVTRMNLDPDVTELLKKKK
jgi:ribosome maturation factor RimP